MSVAIRLLLGWWRASIGRAAISLAWPLSALRSPLKRIELLHELLPKLAAVGRFCSTRPVPGAVDAAASRSSSERLAPDAEGGLLSDASAKY